MPLVVYPAEGYDSFVSLQDADTYLANLGYAFWPNLSAAEREAALRRGTQYVFSRRLNIEALWDTAETPYLARVHPNVAAATCEAAIRHTQGKLYADVDPSPVIEKTVGPLSVRYGTPANGGQARFPVIDDLLFGLTYSGVGYGPVTFERV